MTTLSSRSSSWPGTASSASPTSSSKRARFNRTGTGSAQLGRQRDLDRGQRLGDRAGLLGLLRDLLERGLVQVGYDGGGGQLDLGDAGRRVEVDGRRGLDGGRR